MDWLIPNGHFGEYALVAVIAFAVTALAVIIHYEGLRWIVRRNEARRALKHRRTMLKTVYCLLLLHFLEIWVFGIAYWVILKVENTSVVIGQHAVENMFDMIYLSATTYSTLGFGDLAPMGPIRLMSGLESVTGMLLVTWSASFTYLEMSRLWTPDNKE